MAIEMTLAGYINQCSTTLSRGKSNVLNLITVKLKVIWINHTSSLLTARNHLQCHIGKRLLKKEVSSV